MNQLAKLIGENRARTLLQFVRFCLVGASGMLVDMGVTALAHELLGIDARLGAIAGFSLAVCNNYLLNRRWTFRNDSKPGHGFSFTSFLLISAVGMLISIGVMHACMSWLGMAAGRWYLMARFCGIVVATAWNFTGAKLIAFRA